MSHPRRTTKSLAAANHSWRGPPHLGDFSLWSKTRKSMRRRAVGGSDNSIRTANLIFPRQFSKNAFPVTSLSKTATSCLPVTHLDIEEQVRFCRLVLSTSPLKFKFQKEDAMKSDDGSRRRFLKTSSMLGLAVAFSPGTTGEAFVDSRSKTVQKEDAMAQTGAAQRGGEQADAIRPFHVNVPEAELTELRRRIKATRWPDRETVTDESQGLPLATIQELAPYWATDYDWRKCEAKLNVLPQFMTEIDGLYIHFIHVRSKHENALPLIVTYGWPGSVLEQLKIIEPLTNPTAHGGSASDAFHLVI